MRQQAALSCWSCTLPVSRLGLFFQALTCRQRLLDAPEAHKLTPISSTPRDKDIERAVSVTGNKIRSIRVEGDEISPRREHRMLTSVRLAVCPDAY